jgi:cellobiose phosphorylase
MVKSWDFIDYDGTFSLDQPQHSSHLYFPLVNEAGMMSVVTPNLHGDIKAGQYQFLTPPVSVFDIHNTRSARNFWLSFPGQIAWSVTGNAAPQIAQLFTHQEADTLSLTAGFLWHKLTRENNRLGVRAEICNFVPMTNDLVELFLVEITNISKETIRFSPTAAIPIFGRSADNLRDHRHVTSLLNRINCNPYGVVVKPTLTFDERGHQKNDTVYVVLGIEDDKKLPVGFFPIIDDFIGEGGNLSWPEAVVKPLQPLAEAGFQGEGYEALGGLRFADKELAPGETCSYILLLGILPSGEEIDLGIETYGTVEKFDYWLNQTKNYWSEQQKNFSVKTRDKDFNQWLKWVSVQPTLRRLFGNSFLPYHDYGRGGRGWRDLWQDILALMITEGDSVEEFLFSNFAGVRLDGSNATIIGDRPGEFKADRNNIPRVWMDHGAWPFLTVKFYIDQTGDLCFLLREQAYFKDNHIKRAQDIDKQWDSSSGTSQLTEKGKIAKGTILEHLLVQHLTTFFNVGEHNIIRLEGADWNDALDMAQERGESVAFSALYAGNLLQICELIQKLKIHGVQEVELAVELGLLLDTLTEKIDYNAPSEKQHLLNKYLTLVSHNLSGEKLKVRIDDLVSDLHQKADWLINHIRDNEWLTNQEGYGWFNGYYDNNGDRLEGDHPQGVRMTLTGQVFTLLCGIADQEQAKQLIRSVDHYLVDPAVGGPRLNTDFKDVLLNMGRCFGFAYGHKENGAMFSHMAVMYAYALYERGFATQAFQILKDIYKQSTRFAISRMYPGIPEYFDDRGRGVYPYLTGSASWYIFALLTQAYGIRGDLGDLKLIPKLVAEQFNQSGETNIRTIFAARTFEVKYVNPEFIEYGDYIIDRVLLNGKVLHSISHSYEVLIPRETIESLDPTKAHHITIELKEGK